MSWVRILPRAYMKREKDILFFMRNDKLIYVLNHKYDNHIMEVIADG